MHVFLRDFHFLKRLVEDDDYIEMVTLNPRLIKVNKQTDRKKEEGVLINTVWLIRRVNEN